MQETKDSSTLMLYLLVALIVVIGVAWLLLSMRGGPPPLIQEPVPATTVDAELTDEQSTLQQNLEMGALAFNAGQLLQPADGSALSFYLRARTLAPDNEAVVRGLAQLSQQIGVRARVELTGQQFGPLLESMRALAAIDATDPRLQALNDDLALLVASKLDLIDGAIARGEWAAAQALIDEIAILPATDDQALTLRRDALAQAQEGIAAGGADTPGAQPIAAARVPAQGATATDAAATDAAAQPAVTAPASATPAAAAPAAATPAAAAPQAEAEEIELLLASLQTSLEDGRLTTPVNDSAAYYLQEVARVEPDHPRLAAGVTELVGALTQRALGHGADGNWTDADEALAQAESLGAGGQLVEDAREQVLAARIAQESSRVVPVQELQNLKVVRPRYPTRALRNGVTGWVVVVFTVLPDGTTADVQTVEDSGRYGDLFGRAAAAAVAKWEFVPRVFLGQTIPQRVRARVTFELQD